MSALRVELGVDLDALARRDRPVDANDAVFPVGVSDWGEVLVWEPPRRLAYLWHLRFDRSDATEVSVTFTEAPTGTEVRIVHHVWERHGAAGPERRERNRKGWAGVLEHYRRACA
jgi:uncharacterized protein YndB with AHSA1/START domain